MPSTAKRRWSRELPNEVDGIAIGSEGPILLHGYDPPAGGKWIDDVIPGKLGALDRNTGEELWMAPCEVGYGRGFGAGVGEQGQVIVLGPSMSGHRIVRMAMSDGELLQAAAIPAFDVANVQKDVVICGTPGKLFAIDSADFKNRWVYGREGERYHHITRIEDRALVVFTKEDRYGVLVLDAETGDFDRVLVPPRLESVYGLAATPQAVVVLTSNLGAALEGDAMGNFLRDLALHPSGGMKDTLTLAAWRLDGRKSDDPLWSRILETSDLDDLPDASIAADGGKLYVERGAHLEALDGLSGRALGEWTVPGLDERIAWRVADGAGLLAEETRVSIFELPA